MASTPPLTNLAEDSSEEDEPINLSSVDPTPPVSTDIPTLPTDATISPDSSSNGTRPTINEAMEKLNAKCRRAYAAVSKDPWATEYWTNLLNEIQKLSIEECSPVYDEFLERFPTSGHWWKTYAEHELQNKHFVRVQEILQKALMEIQCCNVELWKFYLNFTKLTKWDTVATSADVALIKRSRQTMNEAYEVALSKIGESIQSSPIWQGYISFLKTDKDPQAFLAVRKAYQKAVVIPVINMDTIWKDYESFEKSIPNNEQLAQNFLKLYRPKFDAARAVLKDRKHHWEGINVNLLAVPAAFSSRPGKRDDQLKKWQSLIEFELSNPEMLDPVLLKTRVRLAFEHCLCCKRYSPEIWNQYAMYEEHNGDHEAAAIIFRRAIEAIPDSYLLSFAFADHQELRSDLESSKEIYEKLLADTPSPLVYINYMRFARRNYGAKGLDEARAVFKRARKDKREGACSHHVFAAAALLEFHTNTSESRKTVALNIFELGLKKYMKEVDYVLCYLDFLKSLNEENNMRSLFEKVLNIIPPEDAVRIWDHYLNFEHTISSRGGNLAAVVKLEERRAKAYEAHPTLVAKGLLGVVHRYEFLGLRSSSRDDGSFYDLYKPKEQLEQVVPEPEVSPKATTNASGGNTKETKKETRIPGPMLPDFLKPFVLMLPIGDSWNGPIADVDFVYRALMYSELPTRSSIEHREAELTKKLTGGESKKGAATDTKNDSDDENANPAVSVQIKRPAHDVFRSRQQQKIAKLL